MQAFLNQLLNQARAQAPSALPTLLRRSVGTIDDVIVRPATRFSQELLTKPIVGPARTFRPGKKAEQLVREQTGRFVPMIMPPASSNAPRYTQSAAQRFFQEFGGAAETTARTLIGQSGLNQANSMVRSFSTAAAPYLKPSSAFARVPVLGSMPGWAQSLVAPTSVAGTIFGLTQLEGSTPQSGDPYDNWQRLGYSSKDDMLRRVSRQAQIENSDRARGSEQYGPPIPTGITPPAAPGLPADYKKTELAAGAAAEAFRPGAGFPGQQAALDLAYEADKRRALQLAEQDQLAKKYQVADLTKAYNTAATPEEKQRIGLQIWATTNPQLTQGVKPGQVGYEQAQAAINTPGLDQLSQTQKALLKQAFQQQLNK